MGPVCKPFAPYQSFIHTKRDDNACCGRTMFAPTVMRVQIIYTAGHPRVASLALTGNSPSEGTPPYSIILYYGMLVKPLDKMYPVGCDDLGAPYQTVGTICIRIRAHLTISWAANDRPYGITVADEFTCGAPGSYPRAPSLALRAIHLGAPLRHKSCK